MIRFDPAISRAVDLAIVEGIVYRQANSLYRLTEKGKSLVESIYQDDSIMQEEKVLFSELANKLTEDLIERIAETWRTL